MQDMQASASVDLFFVHATTAFQGLGNATLDEAPGLGLAADFTSKQVGRYASAFNGSCRIFAPKYRQARCNNYHVLSGSRGEADELLPVYGYRESHVGAEVCELNPDSIPPSIPLTPWIHPWGGRPLRRRWRTSQARSTAIFSFGTKGGPLCWRGTAKVPLLPSALAYGHSPRLSPHSH